MSKNYLFVSSVFILAGCGHFPNFGFGESFKTYDTNIDLPGLPSEFEGRDVSADHEAANIKARDWLGDLSVSKSNLDLIHIVLSHNPTIKALEAAVEREAATTRATTSLAPILQFSTGSNLSYRQTGIPSLSNPNPGSTTDFTGTDRLSASWEIDIWGRLRKAIKEGRATELVRQFELSNIKLSLTGQTLTSSYNLAANARQLEVANDTLDARKKVLSLTERRLLEGTTSALDVRTARSAQAAAEAEIYRLGQTGDELRRQINTLMGAYPSSELSLDISWPEYRSFGHIGSPLELLARRPDVKAAEQRLVAAGLTVDRTRRSLLPALTLTGQADQAFTSIVSNLDIDDLVANILANFTLTLFDGGLRKSQINVAKASAKQTLADYVNTALAALREVENALAADKYLALQLSAQSKALVESRAAEKIAERNYTSGVISVFELINAQTNRLDAERAMINLELSRAINRVDFFIALGGGIPESLNAPPASGSLLANSQDRG